MEIKKIDLSNRLYALSAVVVAVMVVSLVLHIVDSWKSAAGDYPREITVEGTGKVSVKPDLASVNIGVRSEGSDLTAVVDENNKKSNAIIAAIKELGVAENDLTTDNYYVNPNYKYSSERGSYTDGFIAEQSVVVKIRDLEKLGEITAAATANGSNNISDINFIVDDSEAAKAEAREKAIANAKAKAEKIAAQTDLKLGKVVSFWESANYDYYPERYYNEAPMMATADGASVSVPTMMTGTQDVVVDVSLSFKVK